MGPRVCVIGAGQSGMAVLYNFAKLGDDLPDVTCYERGTTWGGQWNCPWRTVTDEYGERIQSGMYRTMWINGPKESIEIPHYTFDKHFGEAIPSFFPAPTMRSFLEGYWRSSGIDLRQMIRFNTAVHSVKYNDYEDNFTVITRDLPNQKTNSPETFSHVIVATGNYACPNAPEFKGFDSFPGRIMHSQQFRGGQDFKGKQILVVGAFLSAVDVAGQSYKHGASHVIITWRSKPLGFKFPEGIEERPLLQEMDGQIAKFKDGSTAVIDIIVLCTGYNMSFPFLEDSLMLPNQRTSQFPANLYKGVVWLGGGNKKLMYLGMQMHPLSSVLSDLQAVWIVRYITGINPVNNEDKQPPGWSFDPDIVKEYLSKMEGGVAKNKDVHSMLEAATEFLQDLNDDVGHNHKPAEMMATLVKSYKDHFESFIGVKDQQHTSVYTGITATPPKTKWIDSP